MRTPWTLLIVGVLAGAGCVGMALAGEREAFFRAYLFAWLCILGLGLGGMCLLMLHNLTGGAWGEAIRGVSECAARTIPLLAVLFIPVALGMQDLYVWARPGEAARNEILLHRQAYLNVPFFWVRAAAYLAIWIGLSLLLLRWQDHWRKTRDIRWYLRVRGLSAAGLIIYLWTMTHAGIDWILSRDIDFYSTTFGFILTVGQTLGALALAIGLSRQRGVIAKARAGRAGVLNDVGNVLLTLVILWTYVSFMQLLVIWMGNSREDNTWYLQRGLGQPGAWRWFALGLVVFHFFIPFFVLLFRAGKQYLPALRVIAWLLLASFVAEQYWLIAPSGVNEGPVWRANWLDPLALVAMGGIWLAAFLWIRAWFEKSGATFEMPQPPEGAPAHD